MAIGTSTGFSDWGFPNGYDQGASPFGRRRQPGSPAVQPFQPTPQEVGLNQVLAPTPPPAPSSSASGTRQVTEDSRRIPSESRPSSSSFQGSDAVFSDDPSERARSQATPTIPGDEEPDDDTPAPTPPAAPVAPVAPVAPTPPASPAGTRSLAPQPWNAYEFMEGVPTRGGGSTDLTYAGAYQALGKAYKRAFNRDVTKGEVDTHLSNIGWQPGDNFVGRDDVYFIIQNLPKGAGAPDAAQYNQIYDPATGNARPELGPTPGAPGATTPPGTTGTGGTPGTPTKGWGYDSPTGGRVEFDYTPTDYGSDMTNFSGFSPIGQGSSDPTALKNIFRNAAVGLGGGEGGFTEADVDEVVKRLNAMGLNVTKVDPYQIDFHTGEGPMQVRTSRNEVWWNNRATENGGGEGGTWDGDAGDWSRPASLEDAVAKANAMAYGGRQQNNAAYWQDFWNEDPEYTWQRMLGQYAGGADVALAGPHAGAQGGGGTTGAGGSGLYGGYREGSQAYSLIEQILQQLMKELAVTGAVSGQRT